MEIVRWTHIDEIGTVTITGIGRGTPTLTVSSFDLGADDEVWCPETMKSRVECDCQRCYNWRDGEDWNTPNEVETLKQFQAAPAVAPPREDGPPSQPTCREIYYGLPCTNPRCSNVHKIRR